MLLVNWYPVVLRDHQLRNICMERLPPGQPPGSGVDYPDDYHEFHRGYHLPDL